MKENDYLYNVKVVSVYDADTFKGVVDLGFGVHIRQTFRLFGINAPEMRGAEKIQGKKSRDYVRKKILSKTVLVRTEKLKKGWDKKGKFGRYLATVYYGDNINLNVELVKKDLAIERVY